jgi:hypothetical protein
MQCASACADSPIPIEHTIKLVDHFACPPLSRNLIIFFPQARGLSRQHLALFGRFVDQDIDKRRDRGSIVPTYSFLVLSGPYVGADPSLDHAQRERPFCLSRKFISTDSGDRLSASPAIAPFLLVSHLSIVCRDRPSKTPLSVDVALHQELAAINPCS